MPLHPEVDLTVKLDSVTGIHEDDRNNLRKALLDSLVEEEAGTGTGDNTSKYRYNVESLSCGNIVYLTRPVPLNKGFDFVIHAENYVFTNSKDNPKHDDILSDLQSTKKEDNSKYDELYSLIDLVYHCHDPVDILPEKNVKFNQGFPVDMVLKVIKWLFIEQDIRYWNWSGRNMFMSAIREI